MKARAMILLMTVALPVAALPFGCDFDADTPGQPPALGGAGQPSDLQLQPGASILVQAEANGLDTQPCLIDDGATTDWCSIWFDIDAVSDGILRIEATLALDRYVDGYALDAISRFGNVGPRIGLSSDGTVTNYEDAQVLGSYVPALPFRLRMDVDLDSDSWTGTVDDEMDGFENDTAHSGLQYVSDPMFIPDIVSVGASLNTEEGTEGATTLAYDDILIDPDPPSAARASDWTELKALY